MKGGLKKSDLDAAWYTVRKKVGDIRGTLPEGVRGPSFNDEYNDVYSVLYAVSAPDLSMAELLRLTEDLKRQIQAVAGVNKVDVIGKQAVNLGKEAVGDVLNGSTKDAGKALDKAGSAIKGLFK